MTAAVRRGIAWLPLEIGIVSHQDRLLRAQNLADQVTATYISMDDGQWGCEQNHLQVWQHLTEHNTSPWSVVLEDDAEPVEGFRLQLAQALKNAPTNIVGLYLGKGRPHWQNWPTRIQEAITEAETSGACWIISKHLLQAVGVAIKTPLAAQLVNDMMAGGMKHPIDTYISQWAQRRNEPIAYTMPSLIDHADLPTLVQHQDGEPRTEPRKAWITGTRKRWTNAYVAMNDPDE